MQASRPQRLLLLLCGSIAVAIGAGILLSPHAFFASNGIELGADPNQLSEVRAPGAALLVLGAGMLCGVWVRSWTQVATALGAAVYLAYGAARLASMAIDGLPAGGLVGATVVELLLGVGCLLALRGGARRAQMEVV